jgi:hypothetical protein
MANPIISLKVAQLYDIEAYESDTTVLTLELYDDDNAPFAISDVEVKIRTKAGVLHDTFNVASGEVVISGAGSNIATISGWNTLADDSYDYDLAIIYDTAKKTTLFYGETRVTPDK